MCHQLITFLGSSIKRYGIIHLIISAIRYFLITAIDRRRRGVNKMLHSYLPVVVTMATCFKDIIKTYNITFNISIRISDTVAYTCLCSQVYHNLRLILLKQFINKKFVRNISFNKNKTITIFIQLL